MIEEMPSCRHFVLKPDPINALALKKRAEKILAGKHTDGDIMRFVEDIKKFPAYNPHCSKSGTYCRVIESYTMATAQHHELQTLTTTCANADNMKRCENREPCGSDFTVIDAFLLGAVLRAYSPQS